MLAQYRDEHGLSQTELGQIDPTSETIRLATLGMRGIAGTTLWWKATQYQMKKDWTRLRATLDQISKLQPHSIHVWRYQAWNLSYNVSVSFDDYHDKFYWVIEGLNFMLDGVRTNDKEPRLYWDMAWFISNKIGRDDAAKYYRRLFSGERGPTARTRPITSRTSANALPRPRGFPPGSDIHDNWHVGKAWFLAAESKIDPPRYPVRGMAPVIFYSDAPPASSITPTTWKRTAPLASGPAGLADAEDEWHAFGERPSTRPRTCSPATEPEGRIVRFRRGEEGPAGWLPRECATNGKGKTRQAVARGTRGLGQVPGGLGQVQAERSTEGRQERETALAAQRGRRPRSRAEARPDEIARRSPQAHRQEAMKLAKEIERDEMLALYTNRERSKVNFDFWRTRARAEQTRRVPGRAEGHPQRRPGLRQGRLDPRPAGV